MWRRSRCAAHWRPVLAPSLVRREASVCVSVGGPSMPSSHARLGLAGSNPALTSGASGKFDAACRRTSASLVRTSSSVTRTLPCRLAESHNFSPPPSPAIAVFATSSSLPRLMDARARCEMAITPSPREYSLSLTVTQNEPLVDPRGEPAVLCFGYRLGTGVPPWGPPPHPGPALHSNGRTALHWAAAYGNRRMIRSLVDAKAAVDAQDRDGCAVCARGESAVECAGRVAAAVCRAGTRRCTMPRPMAVLRPSRSCCCAAPTGPSRTNSGTAAPRRAAEAENRNSRARAGTRRSNGRKTMSDTRKPIGSSRHTRLERRMCTPPAASQPPPTHPASRPIRPRAACAVGVCRRRSPIQRGGRQRPTQHSHCNERPRRAPLRALLHPRVEV
jgi:hypothetical protein